MHKTSSATYLTSVTDPTTRTLNAFVDAVVARTSSDILKEIGNVYIRRVYQNEAWKAFKVRKLHLHHIVSLKRFDSVTFEDEGKLGQRSPVVFHCLRVEAGVVRLPQASNSRIERHR